MLRLIPIGVGRSKVQTDSPSVPPQQVRFAPWPTPGQPPTTDHRPQITVHNHRLSPPRARSQRSAIVGISQTLDTDVELSLSL